MHDTIQHINSKAQPKLKALLRTIPYYTKRQLITQYKTHILPLTENCTGSIYHAATTHLTTLDPKFTFFIHILNLTHTKTFLNFNLAPPNLRRDIGLLELLLDTYLKLPRTLQKTPDFEKSGQL